MIYVLTLAFNLPSETLEATRYLYELNRDVKFVHLICDLGFPLEYGADVPDDIEASKDRNSVKLKQIAELYGSEYVKFENIGVSANWNQVLEYIKTTHGFTKDDALISCEPDERPVHHGWIQAIYDVLSNKKIAAAGLIMPDQKPIVDKNHNCVKSIIKNRHVYLVNGTMSVAQIGFSGKYLLANNGVPTPENHAIYGYLESAFSKSLHKHGLGWALLKDFEVLHTETSTLYREWKTDITSGEYKADRQIQFSQWLEIQKTKSQ